MVVLVVSCVYIVKLAESNAFARAAETRSVSVSPEYERESGERPCSPSQSVIALTLSALGEASRATYFRAVD